MNVPKFNEREKALENDYIRKKEAEKFKSSVPKPGTTSTGPQGSAGGQQTNSGNQK
ncbi:uncharacterized protein AB675_9198 [Cyphellophora attinorum]|uniref:Uncharacterized protein n=1 Tax=Cyphellophora attinorum TaxID=1664694 RepID=A0A0N0NNH8_9EURO|nr:uncharacterized protein AB675_9198 [Phialophora attinorum]KPI41631.1 hypothetical protein AB675_9198 [Phialophora attinorum]